MCGSKGLPSAPMGCHALGLEQGAQLAVDGRDALHPGRVARVRRHVLDGQVEVVRELEHPQQEPVAGEAASSGALLLGAALAGWRSRRGRAASRPRPPRASRQGGMPELRLELLERVGGCAGRAGRPSAAMRSSARLPPLRAAASRRGPRRGRLLGSAWGRRSSGRSCVQVIHQFVHQAAHVADRARWHADRPCAWDRARRRRRWPGRVRP